MAEFSSLAQDVYCIDALYIQPRVASIYLLRAGDEVAIIETGTFHSLPNVLATLQQLGIDRSQVKYVIPTHVHLDHAGGAGEMMRQFEQASLIVHPRGARHMIDPSKLVAGTIGVYGRQRFERLYGSIEPIPEDRIIIAEDLACYRLQQRELVFIDTPGHARHHFCIYDQQSNGMFTGDTFGISYDAMKVLPRGLLPTTPPSQFDPSALKESVARIMNFAPERLYLTHYGEFSDPAAQLASFNQWIDQYVAVCESCSGTGDDYAAVLEQALLQQVMKGLGNGTDEALQRLLSHDIKLNAQGLAHWWGLRPDG
ncbi:MAG: MBL fold metallo-hydrolase [Gammaproteobacteria bacterium]|jgi:glyoxylase-like metal-dependent hydrolase (beta-lactamase superfamily II)|nr:MBL fold metallo-hydrolase [Gammaproteobacteria bacterium]